MYYIKLTNGDDLVCDLKPNPKADYTTVINPMKMQTYPAMSDRGLVETLTLTAWLHPYSDDNSVRINKQNILTVTPASKGLITFYKRQLSVFLQHEKALSQREWEIKEKHERFNRRVRKEKMNEILDQLADLDDFDLPRDPKKLN